MAEFRYFEVEEIRVVKVAAGSLADALFIANAAFANGQHNGSARYTPQDDIRFASGDKGDTFDAIKVTNVSGRIL